MDELFGDQDRAATPPDDATLLARLRGSDESALDAIVRAFAESLTRVAIRYVGTRDIANEVVQDVFVAVWEQRGRLLVHTTLRGYLFTATRNRALNTVRDASGRAARESTMVEALARETWNASTDVAEAFSTNIDVAVREALAALPDRVRQAALLRWCDGLSRAEVAQVMGTTVPTVNNQLTTAASRLRAALRDVHLRRPPAE